jgi:hypothetical protein
MTEETRDDRQDREIREMLSDHEDFKHDHRLVWIGVAAVFLGFWSGRVSSKRKYAIMHGQTPLPKDLPVKTNGWFF